MTAVIRTPYLRITVDGQEVTNRLSATWSLGYDLRVGEATVVVPFSPPWSKYYSYVVIEAGANQATSHVRWSGFIVEFDSTSYPGAVALICRGPLYFADLDQCDAAAGIDLSAAGAGQTDQAIVAFLLFEAGLAAYHGTLGGTGKTLGTLAKDQYRWPLGMSALSMIEAIDQISLGFCTFETTGGSIVRTQITANPGASAAATFTDGVDIFAESTNQQSVMNIKNAVNVTGYNDPATGAQFSYNLQQANPYIINGVRVEPLTSPLLESSTTGGTGISCQEVAEWLLPEVNRGLDTLTLATPRDDVIGPGSTIAVDDLQRLGLSQNVWVQRVQGSVNQDGFTQVFTGIGAAVGTGGQGDTAGGSGTGGGGSINPPPGGGGSGSGGTGGSNPPVDTPPIVDFTIAVEQETIVVSGSEQDLFVVSCTSAVTPGSAPISSYAWSTSGGSPHPASGTDADFATSYASISTQTITLTVTDTNGAVVAVTKPIPSAVTVQYVNRRLYLAGTTTIDDFDGAVWRVSAQTSTVVANGPLWTNVANALLTSPDDLQTPSASVNPLPSGNLRSIWFESTASDKQILVGNDSGQLAYSTDGGSTWTMCAATPSGSNSIRRCVWSRYVRGQFFALCDTGLFRSDNFGHGWVTVVAAAGGETFNDVSISFKRIMIAMSGGRLLCDQAGVAQTLPGVATNMIAITADIKADRFYCYDSAGHTFYHSADGGTSLARRADLPASGGVRGMWRDEYIRGLLYIAAGAAYKSVDGLASTAGYFVLRQAGVGTAPIGASYTSIGANGIYSTRIVPPNTVPSAAGVGVCFHLGTEPAGWQQPGFNSTGWAASVADPTVRSLNIPGAAWVTQSTGTKAAGETFLLRHVFSLSGGTIHSATLTVAEDAIADVWVNGTNVYHYSRTSTDPSGPHTVAVAPAMLRPGASNVLAIKLQNDVGGPYAVTYKLAVN